jgi:hypothetical protein
VAGPDKVILHAGGSVRIGDGGGGHQAVDGDCAGGDWTRSHERQPSGVRGWVC